jgi:hypothetical protein
MPSPIVLFAGPSLYGTGLHPKSGPDIEWRAPARRGDIEALINSRAPGAIGLADGTFHSYPSVGHVELREALAAGWSVFGLCSMGAIRAAEMLHMGMQPWGEVARHFCRHIETPDDEVALVHGTEWPYVPFSEPLVHVRAFLTRLANDGILSVSEASAIAAHLASIWYGNRTLGLLAELLIEHFGSLPTDCAALLCDFSQFRLKQQDLLQFVTQRPWLIC